MLGCPLATHSDTLWLTAETDPYHRRFGWAIAGSVGFHAAIVLFSLIYFIFNSEALSIKVNQGNLDLPVHVKVVTQNTQAAREQELETKSDTRTITTSASSEIHAAKENDQKTAQKQKAQTGNHIQNATASAVEESDMPGLNDTVTVDSKPRFRSQPEQPIYPAQAIRRKQEGTAMVGIIVEPNGKTADVELIRSSGFALLDAEALRAVRKWQIMAHTINGQPVRGRFVVPVDFYFK